MSIGAWEKQALDSIADGLAGSAPDLASLLAIFSRLASGEAMPAREKLQMLRQDRPHRSGRYPRGGKTRPDARSAGRGSPRTWPLLGRPVSAGPRTALLFTI